MTTTDLKDDVEIRSLDSVIPYGENPKEHPTEQVDKIASSIQRFGWDQPIVVDAEGTIIKGHGRYQAAQKLGLDEVPIIEQADLSEAQARAARIADNKTAESEWDGEWPLKIQTEKRGKYGRYLATITRRCDGAELTADLLAEFDDIEN